MCTSGQLCNVVFLWGQYKQTLSQVKKNNLAFLFVRIFTLWYTCLYSGAEEPPYYECRAAVGPIVQSAAGSVESAEGYTCQTEIQNVVDVYYFAADDNISCQHQVSISFCDFIQSDIG